MLFQTPRRNRRRSNPQRRRTKTEQSILVPWSGSCRLGGQDGPPSATRLEMTLSGTQHRKRDPVGRTCERRTFMTVGIPFSNETTEPGVISITEAPQAFEGLGGLENLLATSKPSGGAERLEHRLPASTSHPAHLFVDASTITRWHTFRGQLWTNGMSGIEGHVFGFLAWDLVVARTTPWLVHTGAYGWNPMPAVPPPIHSSAHGSRDDYNTLGGRVRHNYRTVPFM